MQSQIPENFAHSRILNNTLLFRCDAVQCGINSSTYPKSDLPPCFIMQTEAVLPLTPAVCVHKFVCPHVSGKSTFKDKIFKSGCHAVVDFC